MLILGFLSPWAVSSFLIVWCPLLVNQKLAMQIYKGVRKINFFSGKMSLHFYISPSFSDFYHETK